jgi:hypothetical protein
MVNGSIRVGRLRPLGLRWVAAGGREPSSLREQVAEWSTICMRAGWSRIGGFGIAQSVVGSSAAGPSSRRAWKQRRVSLRAIVSEVRGWTSIASDQRERDRDPLARSRWERDLLEKDAPLPTE